MRIQEEALNVHLASMLNALDSLVAIPEVTPMDATRRVDIAVHVRPKRGRHSKKFVAIECKVGMVPDQESKAIEDAKRWIDHPNCMGAIAVCYRTMIARSGEPAGALKKGTPLQWTIVSKRTSKGRWIEATVETIAKQVVNLLRRSRKAGKPNGTPKTTAKPNRRAPKWRNVKERRLKYRSAKHANLPHVVKFSGGRSSGMLLATLIENRLLDAERGDVVLFANTAAEHPATYDFVHQVRLATEYRGIPFLAVEFCTYEAASQGRWNRKPTYRLVRTEPVAHARRRRPNGQWQTRGEVFEEMLSHTGSVPTRFTRTCTDTLKIRTGARAIEDWATANSSTPALGSQATEGRMTDAECIANHARHGGTTLDGHLLAQREYVRTRPTGRPSQRYEEYTIVKQPRLPWRSEEHVALIGLRGDEGDRAESFLTRANNPDSPNYIPGEIAYCPLYDWGVDQDEVREFWKQQIWDLNDERTGPISNCTFCFMKGSRQLRELIRRMPKRQDGELPVPENIDWWIEMDDRYGKDLRGEGRAYGDQHDRLGFFGAGTTNGYRDLKDDNGTKIPKTAKPCHCSD